MPKRVRTVRVNCAAKQPQSAIALLMEYGFVLDSNGLSYPDKLCAWLEKVKIFIKKKQLTKVVRDAKHGSNQV